MSREHLIETFNTHRMSAEVVQAVATAREPELAEVMQAVHRALERPPVQHLIVYGERGSGKSFLMRLVEIEIERLAREQGLPVAAALLPEEQYHIRTAPQLLQAIAARVRGTDWVYEMDFRPLAEAWQAAVAELDSALDRRFGRGSGLVVAMLENFDALARSLFGGSSISPKTSARAREQEQAEQLLRKRMQGPRLMLLASATGTVDQDYERPLFQAFKTLDLRIWTPDDCLTYFNRRRALENQAPLSPPEEARARAIAEFIGGNPRLAQLLGEVLVIPDGRGIAATLDALSDHLADYYRRRLDDLPPQSAALLDALIRKGEPCTQTELAARVGAGSQAQIADAFSYLLSARLLAAGPDPLGAGRLYRLRDRLFVHFYRRRYGEPEQALGLAPIAELLESFFTLREREQQARRLLEAGEWAEARLYVLSRPFLTEPSDDFCPYRDGEVIGTPSELFRLADPAGEKAEVQEELKRHPERAVKHWRDTARHAGSGLERTAALLLEAVALSRCQLDDEAETTLEETLRQAEADKDVDSRILALDGLASFAFGRRKDHAKALNLTARAGDLAGEAHDAYPRAIALHHRALSLLRDEARRHDEAVTVCDEAAALAAAMGSLRLQARVLSGKACSLGRLERDEEAILVAEQVADLAAAAGVVHYQVDALEFIGAVRFRQGRHEAAQSLFGKAAQLAGEIHDEKSRCRLLWFQAHSLHQLKHLDQAFNMAREAAKLAARLGDSSIQGGAIFTAGATLNDLGNYSEAAAMLDEAVRLAAGTGNSALQLDALNARARSLGKLQQHEQAVELAQRAYGIATATGDTAAQADALRLKGWNLARLDRGDEASSAYIEAFGTARTAGHKQRLLRILEEHFNNLEQPGETLVLARKVLAETSDSVEDLWAARRIFFAAAARAPAPDGVEVFETCLAELTDAAGAAPLTEMLATVLAAVAYNGLWEAFAACLSRHPEVLPFLCSERLFAEVGGAWSEQVGTLGRARTYAAVARQWPAILRSAELLPLAGEAATAYGHLSGLIDGLVSRCDDAGFLRDLAGFLEETLGERPEIQYLRTFAEVHAAPDKEPVLQRLDPDLAQATRRILGLAEPKDLLARKGRRKGR